MVSTRFINLLGLVSMGILSSFSLIPNSFAEMVRWPGVIAWQVGFFLAGLVLIMQLTKNSGYRFGFNIETLISFTVLVLLFSTLQAPIPQVGMWYLAMSCNYIIFSYAIYNLQIKALYLVYGLVGTGALSSFLALLLWFPQRDNFDFGMGYQNKLLLGHHNFVGGFLTLLIPITSSLIIIHKGWKRWLFVGVDVMFIMHLFTSSSRGAILGLIVTIGVSFIIFIANSTQINLRKILLLLMIILGTSSLLLSQPRFQNLISIQPSRSETDEIIQLDGNANYRIILWQTSLYIGKAKPFTGVGLGNLSRVYNYYADKAHNGNPIANIHQSHSTFFHILAELGWTGIIAYLLWLCTFARLWWVAFYTSRCSGNFSMEIVSSGSGLSLLAYTFSSQTDYQLENIPIALGLCLLVIVLIQIRNENVGNLNPLLLSTKQNQLYRIIVIVTMIVITSIQAPVTYGMFLAYQARTNFDNPNVALAKILQAKVWDPSNPIYPLSAAHILQDSLPLIEDPVQKQNLERKILDNYKTASLFAPYNDFINFNYGYWQLNGDPGGAKMTLKNALRQSYAVSDQYYGYFFLGLSYLRQSLINQALDCFALQAILDPGYLTYPLWNSDELAPLHQQVISRALNFFMELQPDHFSPENIALVKWWFSLDLDLNQEEFRPIIRFILLWEKEPQLALKLLPLIQDPQQKVILGMWLDPQAFKDAFTQYLAQASQFSAEIQEQLMEYALSQQPTLRDWLNTPFALDVLSPGVIGTGLYAFRNTSLSNAFFSHGLMKQLGIPNRLNLWTPASLYDPVIRNFLREHLP